jgi:periplasmic divalent cation tolerance protein
MTDLLVVLSTFPSPEVAARVADQLVEERLAACVNLVPGLTSIYRWKGELAREPEVLALIKTRRDRFDALSARLSALHPYEVPEVVALSAEAALAAYAAWVHDQTTAGAARP